MNQNKLQNFLERLSDPTVPAEQQSYLLTPSVSDLTAGDNKGCINDSTACNSDNNQCTNYGMFCSGTNLECENKPKPGTIVNMCHTIGPDPSDNGQKTC